MHRSHNCGALSESNLNQEVILAGWVQKVRNKGFIVWVDLRDRYGITQLVFDEKRTTDKVFKKSIELGREDVIQVKGNVIERESKNPNISTGSIELQVNKLTILNKAQTPPFTIENETDGGDELRMQYRYLDLRRNPVKENMILRHRVTMSIRNFLSKADFIDVETPYLIKSTPEGARDFIVPSRMNNGQFYALPQSPQTFKQLLMVGGFDKYFQIVKCFRDEDLRADRQPEFTQIDCEMSFVEQEDVLSQFEELIKHLFQEIKGIKLTEFPRISYAKAMEKYGSDKPDIRFGMTFGNLNEIAKGKGFNVFDSQELIIGIAVPGGANYTRKEIDNWIDWVKRPQVGAKGLIWVKCNEDGSYKSSVDNFFNQQDLAEWSKITNAHAGDLIFVMAGDSQNAQTQLSALRIEIAEQMGLRKSNEFAALWVTDFPLLAWDDDSKRYHAMHHPFTAPKNEHLDWLTSAPEKVLAKAYDLVLNGNEIGGGSIRIHDTQLQEQMFSLLGFTKKKAKEQFGFLMNAFQYGAPPHGGIALGLDRLVALLGGSETIKDFIAFPKNNNGRDVMIDAPAKVSDDNLEDLYLKSLPKKSSS
ncbi:MAG: aspartate--tRNA ligase [Flavobacteriaceae bacterium]|nr:aspartate--tRNA ligase [Flavobacteriaceae bacterium]